MALPSPIPASPEPQAGGVIGRYRWLICALLFLATTVNYVDRQILALIKEFLDKELGWSNEQFGLVNSAFAFAYAIGTAGESVCSAAGATATRRHDRFGR